MTFQNKLIFHFSEEHVSNLPVVIKGFCVLSLFYLNGLMNTLNRVL